MVESVELSQSPGRPRQFDLLVAVDEGGLHSEAVPTVVSAVYVERSESEAITRRLIEHDIDPFLDKSGDVTVGQIAATLDSLDVPTSTMATWRDVPASKRGLMAIEAVKRAVQRAPTPKDGRRNCLVLLDGRPLNYGNEPSILRSKAEILDSYVQKQNGITLSIATLEKGDRRYPEITLADLVCRLRIDRITSDGSVDAVERVTRFDANRSVPSREYGADEVRSLAGIGVSDETAFRSKVLAWCRGRRPSVDAVGTDDHSQYRRAVQLYVDDDTVARYCSQEDQPGSRQA